MINREKLIHLVREQITELPESVLFSRDNISSLIQPGIALWQEQTNNNKQKRHNFIQQESVPIANGAADLSSAIDNKGFRLEYIREGDLEITTRDATPNLTVKFVASLNRLKLPGRADKFFVLAYLSGTSIRFRDPDAASGEDPLLTMSGDAVLRSVVLPNYLDGVPESIAPELALVIADLARKQFLEQNRGLNLPIK